MPFDTEGARKSGYTDAEIADHLGSQSKFDVAGARKSGYTDAEIISHLSAFDAPKPRQVSADERTGNLARGMNAGIAGTGGIPVDTALNVWDLAKAGAGYLQGKATGKPPSDIFEPSDRKNLVMSSDWIRSKMDKSDILNTQNTAPDDSASRYLHLVGNIGSSILLGRFLPGQPQQPVKVPLTPKAGSSASSNASASATPGVAASQSIVSANPTAIAKGGGYTFGHVADDAASGLTRGQQSAAKAGTDIGMRLTPGQATGNKLLQRMEAKLESQPMTAGPFDRVKDLNQKVLNEKWAKAIGETSDSLDTTTLARAQDRIGNVFEDVRDEVVREIDPGDFVSKLKGVSDEFEAIAPQIWKHPLVDRLVRHAENGGATGKDLGNLTSKLGREANKHMTSANGDRELGAALFKVKDYVDDLVEQGLTGGRKIDYAQARREYRNLMLLTQRTGTINPSTGNVSGPSIANLLQSKDKGGYLFGKNGTDAYNAARFAQAFKPIVGDSGTATRMPLTSTLDMLVQAPVNLAARAYTSSPAVNLAVGAQSASHATGEAAKKAAAAAGADNPLALLLGINSSAGLLDDYRR